MTDKFGKFMSIGFLVVVIAIVLYIGFSTAEGYFCRRDAGVVSDKSFVPAHDEKRTVLILVGKVLVPVVTTTHYGDTWFLGVDYDNDGCDGDVSVSQELYNAYSVGQELIVANLPQN